MIDLNIKKAFDLAGLRATRLTLGKNDALFRAGDPVVRMHYVAEGQIVMLRTLENGQELAVQRAGPGNLFAEASLFSDSYHCDAHCVTPVVCETYDKQEILRALEVPEVALSVLKAYSLQIRDLRSQIELRNIKRADQRLLTYLNTLSPDKDGWRDPGLSWKDVSRTLGLTHEACYRALAKLEKEKRIERAAGRYRLVCP